VCICVCVCLYMSVCVCICLLVCMCVFVCELGDLRDAGYKIESSFPGVEDVSKEPPKE